MWPQQYFQVEVACRLLACGLAASQLYCGGGFEVPKFPRPLLFLRSLKQEFLLRVCENRVMRRIFGPKRKGVTERRRKLRKEELRGVAEYPFLTKYYLLFLWRNSLIRAYATSLLRFRDQTRTLHTRYDPSGRGIGPSQRPLRDNTKHSQETDMHASERFRTRNPKLAGGRRPMP
jgi:hypothetical protein